MAKYEVSPDLINQVEILLRKEAGLSPSFKPLDHPPPSPSILQEAIATVGSNCEDALRCESCNGKLLRGIDSIICVFCGSFPNNFPDRSPSIPPISFASTFGFQWFLSSLSLDGSETVERPIEGRNESSRGQSPVMNDIALSALLDMQLTWPDESSRFEVENVAGKRSVKFVGLNFNELFEMESEVAFRCFNEQEVATKKNELKEDTTSAEQSGLSLFENARTRSSDVENDEADWATEFQSATADAKVESELHMDSTNIATFQAFQTTVIESNSELPLDFMQSDSKMSDVDGPKGLGTVGTSLDWLPTSDKQKIMLDGDDSSNNWDEFGMFPAAEINREHTSTTVPRTESGGGFEISDSWNDFTGSLGVERSQLQTDLDVDKPVYGIGNDCGLFGHAGMVQKDANVESTSNMITTRGESLGLGGTSKELDHSFDLWNDYKSSDVSHNTRQPGSKLFPAGDATFKMENDNSLDEWGDFVRSTAVFNSKLISNETSSAELRELSDFSSIMVTHANPSQLSETKPAENQTDLPDDDDFGTWSDFWGSWKNPDSSFAELNLNGPLQDNIVTGRDIDSQSSVQDKNSLNSWGDLGWSTSILEQPSHAVAIPSESALASENSDLFLGLHNSEEQSISSPDKQLKSNGLPEQIGKCTIGNVEDIDAWTEFAGTSNKKANNLLSDNVETDVIQEPVISDPFDVWNAIGSAPNKKSGRVTAVANVNVPQINLFSNNIDSPFVGSNSSMHQDPFMGMLTDQNGSAHVASSRTEAPNLVRTEHQDVQAGYFDSESETAVKERDYQKSAVADNLISEMHDLSFMLESSLSIPKTGT